MPDTAMIFAAGKGTRMGAVTKVTPKPLIHVGGKALIDHALALVDDSPLKRTVVNIHHLGEQIIDHLAGRDVMISHEKDQLLETGGGLKQALTLLNSDEIVTLNSDAVWSGPNPIQMAVEGWNPAEMDALLVLVPTDHAAGHKGNGDFHIDPSGRLKRGPGLIYTGCQIIKTPFVKDVSDDVFSLNVVWDRLLKNQRVFGIEYGGSWYDVGHPEGITIAERMLEHADV